MADALISANHFYMNCAYYNNTNENKRATITIDDTDDILTRSENWLVHVTRFSVDSMLSVAFTEKDPSASWEIELEDSGGATRANYAFILDQEYATPADLINAMNLPGRFINIPSTAPHVQAKTLEMYRFELDNSGRIRLQAQPGGVDEVNNWSIRYTGTDSMNKLLGFKNVTPFIIWDPSAAHSFSQLCKEFGEVSSLDALRTRDIIRAGSFHKDMNDCLIELLNGVRVGHIFGANGAFVDNNGGWSTFPTTGGLQTYGVDLPNLKPHYKGNTPSHAHHDNEALLPRNNAPCVVEWHDISNGSNDGVTTGPKRRVVEFNWSVAYGAANGAMTGGQIATKDLVIAGADEHSSHFPHYVPGTLHTWTNDSYMYPFNSIPGYQLAGNTERRAVAETSIAIEDYHDLNTIALSAPLPAIVSVGDDLMIPETDDTDGTGICCTYAIEWISDDRTTIRIDWPLQEHRLASIEAGEQAGDDNEFPAVIFTDRRVPFQSRNSCFQGAHSIEEAAIALGEVFIVITDAITNVAITDKVAFEFGIGGARETTGEFVVIEVRYPTDPSTVDGRRCHIYCQGALPPGMDAADQLAGVVVTVKKTIDIVRFAQDAERMRMAVPTFCYEGVDLVTGRRSRASTVNGILNPARMIQAYDTANLDLQVKRARHNFKHVTLFDNLVTAGDQLLNEAIDPDTMKLIPHSSEVVHDDYRKRVDFGSANVRQGQGINDAVLQYGNSSGAVPVATITRFPSPWFAVTGYEADGDPDADGDGVVDTEEILAFMRANPFEPAILEMPPNAVLNPPGGIHFEQRGENDVLTRVSPLCVGLKSNGYLVEHARDFIIYAPTALRGEATVPSQPIDSTHFNALFDAQGFTTYNAFVGVAYDDRTRAFAISSKGEWQDKPIQADRPIKLVGSDGDYLASDLSGQIDLMFPYAQMLITSTDLLQIPERSQDASARQPILSSYTLNSNVGHSSDAAGAPAGNSTQPFGTVYFSEGGTRRFHHLIRVPGGLRSFRLNASVTYKDPGRMVKDVILPPGARFSAQLLFMKKDT